MTEWQQWVGCYSLDLYCRNSVEWPDPNHKFNEFPHQFTGETFAECARSARRQGWVIHRDGTATCPRCVRKKVKLGS